MRLRRTVLQAIFAIVATRPARAALAVLSVPGPIPGRINGVGGIESLIIDGRIFYFGYSYRNDIVLSPLIDMPAAMAQFAARYMRQNDGAHDERYWLGIVTAAASESELASERADRIVQRNALGQFVARLKAVERNNRRVQGLNFSYHLLYLLEAANAQDVPVAPTPQLARLGFDDTDSAMNMVLDSVDFLTGKRKLPVGASYRDAACVARDSLDALVRNAPGNWGTVFGNLRKDT